MILKMMEMNDLELLDINLQRHLGNHLMGLLIELKEFQYHRNDSSYLPI